MGGAGSENKAGENEAPVADLKATKKSGFTGESFTFDARGSKDPDGEISEYRFSWGDGTNTTYDPATTEREVEHVYAVGGEYVVTLSVTDDGAENSGVLTSTDNEKIAVNHREEMTPSVIYSAPAGAPPGKYQDEFPVKQEADRIEADVTLRSGLLSGSSEFELELKDESNNSLDKKTQSIGAGTTQNVSLRGTPTGAGTYTLVITPKSGGGEVDGEIRVYYDADLDK